MALHKWWRRQYESDRFLEHQPDNVVLERFRYLLENLTTLTPEGKIGVDGFDGDGSSLWIAFTQTHQEMMLRGIEPPPGFLANAKTANPTFPELAPGQASPTFLSAQLYKFGTRQFMEELKDRGAMRMSPASAFANPNLGHAAADNEIQKKIFPPSARVVLTDATGKKITGAQLKGLEISFDQGTDYLMWCSSLRYSHRMYDDFGYDACVSFSDRAKATRRVEYALRLKLPGWRVMSARIEYVDVHKGVPPSRTAALWKDHRYTYQREVRIIAIPSEKVSALDPLDIKVDLSGLGAEMVLR